ncbi:MAG: hypothetical protein ACRC62_35530 [Microcoleus sp.]
MVGNLQAAATLLVAGIQSAHTLVIAAVEITFLTLILVRSGVQFL